MLQFRPTVERVVDALYHHTCFIDVRCFPSNYGLMNIIFDLIFARVMHWIRGGVYQRIGKCHNCMFSYSCRGTCRRESEHIYYPSTVIVGYFFLPPNLCL